jgi:hypothetical protein
MSELINSDPKKTDFIEVSGSIISNINIKMAIFLFFTGMVIFSDIFSDNFLNNMDGAIHGEITTTKGTVIQLVVFVLCYLILDLLVKGEWI